MKKRRSPTRLTQWDPVDHLNSDRDILGYLNAALQEGDAGLIAAVIGDIARAKGMTEVARQTQFGRESLYKALSAEGNPQLGTVLRVLDALDIELRALNRPKPSVARRAARPGRAG